MPRRNKVRLDVLVLNKVICSSSMARSTEYKTIAVWEMEKSAPLYTTEPACWGLSLVTPSHTRRRWPLSLSHRWSAIRLHPVRRRKGRMCIVSPLDGTEAAHPDPRYPPFSLSKLRRGRAFATCSLPQYGQIPAASALLVTSRRPSGTASSGLAPLPIFPRCCMWKILLVDHL